MMDASAMVVGLLAALLTYVIWRVFQHGSYVIKAGEPEGERSNSTEASRNCHGPVSPRRYRQGTPNHRQYHDTAGNHATANQKQDIEVKRRLPDRECGRRAESLSSGKHVDNKVKSYAQKQTTIDENRGSGALTQGRRLLIAPEWTCSGDRVSVKTGMDDVRQAINIKENKSKEASKTSDCDKCRFNSVRVTPNSQEVIACSLLVDRATDSGRQSSPDDSSTKSSSLSAVANSMNEASDTQGSPEPTPSLHRCDYQEPKKTRESTSDISNLQGEFLYLSEMNGNECIDNEYTSQTSRDVDDVISTRPDILRRKRKSQQGRNDNVKRTGLICRESDDFSDDDSGSDTELELVTTETIGLNSQLVEANDRVSFAKVSNSDILDIKACVTMSKDSPDTRNVHVKNDEQKPALLETSDPYTCTSNGVTTDDNLCPTIENVHERSTVHLQSEMISRDKSFEIRDTAQSVSMSASDESKQEAPHLISADIVLSANKDTGSRDNIADNKLDPIVNSNAHENITPDVTQLSDSEGCPESQPVFESAAMDMEFSDGIIYANPTSEVGDDDVSSQITSRESAPFKMTKDAIEIFENQPEVKVDILPPEDGCIGVDSEDGSANQGNSPGGRDSGLRVFPGDFGDDLCRSIEDLSDGERVDSMFSAGNDVIAEGFESESMFKTTDSSSSLSVMESFDLNHFSRVAATPCNTPDHNAQRKAPTTSDSTINDAILQVHRIVSVSEDNDPDQQGQGESRISTLGSSPECIPVNDEDQPSTTTNTDSSKTNTTTLTDSIPAESQQDETALTDSIPAESQQDETTLTDGIPAESQQDVTKIADGIPAESQQDETTLTDSIPAESQQDETTLTDGIPAESQQDETTLTDGIPAESQQDVTTLTDGIPAESQKDEATLTDSIPAESQQDETTLTDGIPAESQQDETTLTDSIPAESQKDETTLTDSIPAESQQDETTLGKTRGNSRSKTNTAHEDQLSIFCQMKVTQLVQSVINAALDEVSRDQNAAINGGDQTVCMNATAEEIISSAAVDVQNSPIDADFLVEEVTTSPALSRLNEDMNGMPHDQEATDDKTAPVMSAKWDITDQESHTNQHSVSPVAVLTKDGTGSTEVPSSKQSSVDTTPDQKYTETLEEVTTEVIYNGVHLSAASSAFVEPVPLLPGNDDDASVHTPEDAPVLLIGQSDEHDDQTYVDVTEVQDTSSITPVSGNLVDITYTQADTDVDIKKEVKGEESEGQIKIGSGEADDGKEVVKDNEHQIKSTSFQGNEGNLICSVIEKPTHGIPDQNGVVICDQGDSVLIEAAQESGVMTDLLHEAEMTSVSDDGVIIQSGNNDRKQAKTGFYDSKDVTIISTQSPTVKTAQDSVDAQNSPTQSLTVKAANDSTDASNSPTQSPTVKAANDSTDAPNSPTQSPTVKTAQDSVDAQNSPTQSPTVKTASKDDHDSKNAQILPTQSPTEKAANDSTDAPNSPTQSSTLKTANDSTDAPNSPTQSPTVKAANDSTDAPNSPTQSPTVKAANDSTDATTTPTQSPTVKAANDSTDAPNSPTQSPTVKAAHDSTDAPNSPTNPTTEQSWKPEEEKLNKTIKELERKLNTCNKSRENSEAWCGSLETELEAHMVARTRAEERCLRLADSFQKLMRHFAAFKKQNREETGYRLRGKAVREMEEDFVKHEVVENECKDAGADEVCPRLFRRISEARQFWEENNNDASFQDQTASPRRRKTSSLNLDDLVLINSDAVSNATEVKKSPNVIHKSPRLPVKVKIGENDTSSRILSPESRTCPKPSGQSVQRTGSVKKPFSSSPRVMAGSTSTVSSAPARHVLESQSSSESEFYEAEEFIRQERDMPILQSQPSIISQVSSTYEDAIENTEESIANVKRTKKAWESMTQNFEVKRSPGARLSVESDSDIGSPISVKRTNSFKKDANPTSPKQTRLDVGGSSRKSSTGSESTQPSALWSSDPDVQREYEMAEVENSATVNADSIKDITKTKAMWEQFGGEAQPTNEEVSPRTERKRRSSKFLNLRQQFER